MILSILVALGYLRRNRYAGDTEALSSDTSSTRTGKSGKSHKSWGRRSSLDSDSTSTRRKSVDSESGLSIIIPGRPRSDTTDTLPVYSPDSLPGYTREGDIGLASVSASASASTSSARSPPPSSSLSPSTAGVNNNVNISGGMPSGRSHFLSPPPPMRRSNEYGDLRIMDLYGATPIQVPEVPPYSVVERQSSGTPKSGL